MRRRFVWDPEIGELVEITASQSPTTEPLHYVQPDIKEYISPVTGQLIGTRSQHREHMHKHGIAPLDDFKGTMERARTERLLRQQGAHPDQRRERIQALRDSFEHVRNQHRSRGRH